MVILLIIVLLFQTFMEVLLMSNDLHLRVSERFKVVYGLFLLLRFPLVVLETLDTLIHELFHVLAVILTLNRPVRVELNMIGSGITVSEIRDNSWATTRMFIALSGYIGSSIFSYFFALMVTSGNGLLAFYILNGIMVIGLLLFVRNVYGITWLIWLIGLNYYILTNTNFVETYVVLISILLLFTSLRGVLTVAIISFSENFSGDATELEEHSGISRKFWGILFLVIGIYFFLKGFSLVLNFL